MNFEELEEARDEIMDKSLNGEILDFNRLRAICSKMNEENNENFNVKGTDADLWKSVTSFFRGLLKATS